MSTACPFIWYDVMTPDMQAAEAFYAHVVGWTAQAAPPGMGNGPYTVFSAGPTMIGGAMPMPDDARAMGAPPAWTGYVGVPDVDDYARRVTDAGGGVLRGPMDIPGVGRFAVVSDRGHDGAVFIIFRGNGDAMPNTPPGTPGTMGWHELQAHDLDAAWSFYSGVFGWTKAEAMDMGPMGTYQMFATGGMPVGGMMTKRPEAPRPFWMYYVNVPAIDAAAARVAEGGGAVLHGPQEVPGGMWIVQCRDPQGAFFALVAPGR